MPESAIEMMLIERQDATRHALDAMARYKFWMFGYHGARVIFLTSLIRRAGGPMLANPFKPFVDLARSMYCRDCGEMRADVHRCTSESLEWQEANDARPLLALMTPEEAPHD